MLAISDSFMDLSSYLKKNDWLDWKVEGGKANGKIIGAGNDIGPTAVCYRSDLFQKLVYPPIVPKSPRCSVEILRPGISTSR